MNFILNKQLFVSEVIVSQCQAFLAESVYLSSDRLQDVCCPGDILHSIISAKLKCQVVRNLNLSMQLLFQTGHSESRFVFSLVFFYCCLFWTENQVKMYQEEYLKLFLLFLLLPLPSSPLKIQRIIVTA